MVAVVVVPVYVVVVVVVPAEVVVDVVVVVTGSVPLVSLVAFNSDPW